MNIVLLSGGSGKRLWPLSNDVRSKQFIKIFKTGEDTYESMVQRVYRQIKAVDPQATVTIATSKTQVSAIHNQLGNEVGISVEPCRRDTFPAIALATAYLHDVLGIKEEEQGKIFGRFYRAEASRGEDGVGIGLFLAREIARAQGGYIKVKSAQGKGSSFLLYLQKDQRGPSTER